MWEHHWEQGNQLFCQGSYQQAIERYDAALHLRLEYPEAWVSRANALQSLAIQSSAPI